MYYTYENVYICNLLSHGEILGLETSISMGINPQIWYTTLLAPPPPPMNTVLNKPENENYLW